jgi:hypothetical protein
MVLEGYGSVSTASCLEFHGNIVDGMMMTMMIMLIMPAVLLQR